MLGWLCFSFTAGGSSHLNWDWWCWGAGACSTGPAAGRLHPAQHRWPAWMQQVQILIQIHCTVVPLTYHVASGRVQHLSPKNPCKPSWRPPQFWDASFLLGKSHTSAELQQSTVTFWCKVSRSRGFSLYYGMLSAHLLFVNSLVANFRTAVKNP